MNVLARARQGVVLVPEPSRDSLRVTGSDARTWLNGIVTCDTTAVDATRGATGLLLNKQGKIQSDLDVIASGSALLLSVPGDRAESVRQQLDRYLVMEDAELEAAPGLAWVRLIGPKAQSAAQAMTAAVGVGAIDWLGLGGVLVCVPSDAQPSSLAAARAELGEAAAVVSPAEWQALRISRGFPVFGVDFGSDDNPHEASLERRAISWSKGCYLGQEVVCMQDMRGRVKRRVVPLVVAGSEAVVVGSEVLAADTVIGRVTSAASADADSLALAALSAPHFSVGSELTVQGRSARLLQLESAT